MFKSSLSSISVRVQQHVPPAELTGVNRNTATLFFHKLRETIHDKITSDEPSMTSGEIEVDESYSGAVSV